MCVMEACCVRGTVTTPASFVTVESNWDTEATRSFGLSRLPSNWRRISARAFSSSAQLQAGLSRQYSRADRLTVADIALYQYPQEGLSALAQALGISTIVRHWMTDQRVTLVQPTT